MCDACAGFVWGLVRMTGFAQTRNLFLNEERPGCHASGLEVTRVFC